MISTLNENLLKLLSSAASRRKKELQGLIDEINKQEVDHREQTYPPLQAVLLSDELTAEVFLEAIDKAISSWRLKDKIKAYSHDSDIELRSIKSLIRNFPEDNDEAGSRIDQFIEIAFKTGKFHANDGNADKSSIAFFCSILLTAAFPDRFVDFRQNRWKNLANNLGYQPQKSNASYGESIVWSGIFAQDIAKTPTFHSYWANDHPLWAVAGISWNLKNEKIAIKDSSKENNMTKKMETLLTKKKQIILYGPPGTGKTWHARKFILNNVIDFSFIDDERNDINFYHMIVDNDSPDTNSEIKLGSTFLFPLKPNEEWLIEKYGRDQNRYSKNDFDELTVGDIFLMYYTSPDTKYKAIMRFLEKEKSALKLQFVSKWDGPTFKDLKSVPTIKNFLQDKTDKRIIFSKFNNHEVETIKTHYPILLDCINYRQQATVTFHPSFGYEEFIEGLRPNTDKNGSLTFHIHDGIFKQLAQKACNVLFREAGIDKQWLPEGNIPGLDDDEKERIRQTAVFAHQKLIHFS